jgi:hypothetical protein
MTAGALDASDTDDSVLAVVGVNRDREMAALHELMRRERLPAPGVLKQGSVDPVTLLRQAEGR